MIEIKNLIDKISKLKNKKIITVTLNPVIDRTLRVTNFIPGETMKVDNTKILAAGKGVNVSRALKFLNIPSIATGILPKNGSTYYFSLLKEESIDNDFLIANTEGAVRTNITILSNSTTKETHLREKGPELNDAVLHQFKNKLISIAYKADAVIFSGSLPLGLPDDSYEKLIKYLKPRSVKLIALDSSGPPLKKGIRAIPDLLKPNATESKEILGFSPDNTKNIVKTINEFTKLGIQHIILSLGEKGLIYSNGKKIIRAHIKLEKIVNSVGSGDAALAGALAAIMAEFSAKDIAAFSCAMGAANALTYGACIINPSDLEMTFKNVNLETL